MADFDSSLPVRTQNPGDVISKIADATTPSQQLAVDASGNASTINNNGAGAGAVNIQDGGNSITVDATNLDIRDLVFATDKVDVSGSTGLVATVSATNLDIRDLVFATDKVDVSGSTVDASGSTITANQGTSPWIVKDQADGPVAPGTVASFSQLAGGQYNSTPPTLTNAQQAALQLDSAGKLLVSAAVSSSDDHNYGTVGANTLRTAAQIGNATGAADFNNGASGAQTLRVAANLAVAGANVSASNPVPVTISADNPGTEINNFNTAASVAGGASSNHDYTVTGGTTLLLRQINAAGSGKIKMEVQVETGVATGVFTSRFVQFNSTAAPNCEIALESPISVAAGVRVRVIRTNRDLLAQDLYSTISGQEI